MTTLMSGRKWFRLVPVVLLFSWVVGGTLSAQQEDPCDPQVVRKILETSAGRIDGDNFKATLARLRGIDDQDFYDAWNRIANETLDVVDPNVTGGDLVEIHKWTSATARAERTNAEMVAAVKALDRLRKNPPKGELFFGIVKKSGKDDYSSALINNLAKGNRGHFFEPVAADFLIRSKVVDPTRVKGMGFRLKKGNTYLIEGDLVETLPNGKDRYIDFKADGGGFDVDKLKDVEDALRSGLIGEFMYVHEHHYLPSDEWIAKLNQINAGLEKSGLEPIKIRSGGTFP